MNLQRLTVFLLLLLAAPLLARQYDFRHFTVENGLPSPNLYQVLQDRKGYLWFATDNGVSRYDGHSFTTFTVADGFTDYGAFHMMEDSYGRIWFTTFSGEACWYRDGKFTPFTYSYNGKQLKVTWVTEDQRGMLWLSTVEGVVLYLRPDGTIHPIPLTTHKVSYRKLTHSFAMPGGVVFFADEFYFVSNDFHIEKRPYTNAMPILARFFRLNDGTALLTNNTGIYTIDSHSQKLLLPFGAQIRDEIFNIYEDNESNIWVGSTDGVRCFSGGDLTGNVPQHMLVDRRVTSVLRDREGNYWFTTDNGAFMLSSLNVAIYRESEGFSTRDLVGMKRFGQRGLFLLARDGSCYQWRNGAVERLAFSLAKYAPLYPEMSLLTWAGSDSVLIRLTKGGGHAVDRRGLHKVMEVYPWYRQRDGSLWSYELNGIYRVYKGQRAKVYPRLDSTYTYSMYENIVVDNQDQFWIGTRQGLYRQNSQGIVSYGDIEPNLRTFVVGLAASRDGSIWVATKGKGVFHVRGNAITHITTANGLAGDNCELIMIDDDENVWVAGRAGLSRIVIRDGRAVVARTYTTGNILPATDICAVERYGDTVYVAGSEGLMVFDDRTVSSNTTPPPVYISNVTVGGQAVSFSESCDLEYRSGVIAVEYTGIVFRKPGVRSYRYRLLSADTTWNITRSSNVQFPSLEPGSYVLEVMAQNNDGLWSTAPAVLTLLIRPPYWQSWWFRAIVATLGLLFVAGVSVLVIYRRDKRNALQRILLEMELRALRSQMNPHFIFNALNSIQDFIVQRQTRTANLYLTKFARLMRLILEYSRQSSITLESELEFLQLYIDLEQLRFEPSFAYQIRVDPELRGSYVPILPMILQPVVENAIKHGLSPHPESGALVISFEKRDGMLHCTVEDNGIGRIESAKRQQQLGRNYESIGLANTNERLALAHGDHREYGELRITDLYNEDGTSAGTKVELVLPLA